MSGQLPIISGRDAAKAFAKAGFHIQSGRGKGSHMVMYRSDPRAMLTIPDHRELGRGLLRALIRDAGLTVDAFRALL